MKKIFSLLVLSVLLFSCGGNKDERPIQEFLSAFMNHHETIVAFGKVNLNEILKKSEYKSIPKFGMILNKELDELGNSLNLETPVHFALEGPFAEDGTPATTYGFLEVKNSDSLVANLTRKGFDLNKEGEIHFFESGDVAFGIKKNLAIMITKKGDFDGKKFTIEAFKKVTDDVSGGKVDEILSTDGDLVVGVSMNNLYSTSNTDLNSLSKEKQAEVEKMVEDSYVMSMLHLNEGELVFETKNLFSEALASRMFFKEDNSAKLVSKLGTGEARIGLSTNIDMKKMQQFLDEFSPNTLKELASLIGAPAQIALMSGGDDALAGLLSGQIGAVMVGNPLESGAMEPDFNVYLGIEKNGYELAKTMEEFLKIGMAKVELSSSSLAAYSDPAFLPQSGKKIKIPKGCENFGKNGINFFVNLDGIDTEEFMLEDEQRLIYLVKYVNFEMNNNGSKLIVKAKDGNQNIMKQVADMLIEDFSDRIAGMSI